MPELFWMKPKLVNPVKRLRSSRKYSGMQVLLLQFAELRKGTEPMWLHNQERHGLVKKLLQGTLPTRIDTWFLK